jgi:hypothetical protein
MTKYNLHIRREMRLLFSGIEAKSPEGAAKIASGKPASDAAEPGYRLFCPLVDLAGVVFLIIIFTLLRLHSFCKWASGFWPSPHLGRRPARGYRHSLIWGSKSPARSESMVTMGFFFQTLPYGHTQQYVR